MGLFATRDIPVGTRILCEAPIMRVPDYSKASNQEIERLYHALDERARFYYNTLLPWPLTIAKIRALRRALGVFPDADGNYSGHQFYLEWPTGGYCTIDAPCRDVWLATRNDEWPEDWPHDWPNPEPYPDVFMINWIDMEVESDEKLQLIRENGQLRFLRQSYETSRAPIIFGHPPGCLGKDAFGMDVNGDIIHRSTNEQDQVTPEAVGGMIRVGVLVKVATNIRSPEEAVGDYGVIGRIFYENRIDVALFSNQNGGALFLTGSRINHACIPSASMTYNGLIDALTVHASRYIKAGEEITVSYNEPWGDAKKQLEFFHAYQFECKCSSCDGNEESKQRRAKMHFLMNKCRDQYSPLIFRSNCAEKLLELLKLEGFENSIWYCLAASITYDLFFMQENYKMARKYAAAGLECMKISCGGDAEDYQRCVNIIERLRGLAQDEFDD